MDKDTLIDVENLKKYFKVDSSKYLKAVDDVSFSIYKGEVFGLVGESGCGKTTCGRTILGIYNRTDGKVTYSSKDIDKLTKEEKKIFNKKAQMIFQDPYSSLDPRLKVHDIIAEGLQIHKLSKNKSDETTTIGNLLAQVGLNKEHAGRYIHEFSGGQRQRIGIARALALDPEFLVCDEPISALDVSIQSQIINLLMELKESRDLTILFISHDLSIVKYVSDRIGVMYLGKLVEMTSSEALYENPLHPYTKVLISAIPLPDPIKEKEKSEIPPIGDIPSPMDPAEGCRFYKRCKYAMDICDKVEPTFTEARQDHYVACHLFTENNETE